MIPDEVWTRSWVPNQQDSCFTASVLAGLGALGAQRLPELGDATVKLGSRGRYGPVASIWDFIAWPGRKAPVDRRIEALAAEHGIRVSAQTRVNVPVLVRMPKAGEILVAHVGYGQEAPGRVGTFSQWKLGDINTWNLLQHSVVVVGAAKRGGWRVLDSNHHGIQTWKRPGLHVMETRIRLLD